MFCSGNVRAAAVGYGIRARLGAWTNSSTAFSTTVKKIHRLRLRPGRTGNALKMAEELGLSLDGAKAAHQVFSHYGWEIVIDFDKQELPDPVWVIDRGYQ